MHNLRVLDIFNIGMTDSDLTNLRNCPGLARFRIANCDGLTDSIYEQLPGSLKHLSVSNCSGITSNLLKSFVEEYDPPREDMGASRFISPPSINMTNCQVLPRWVFYFNACFSRLGLPSRVTANACFDYETHSSFDASGLMEIRRAEYVY
jgi:hypothetical protein